MDNAHTNRNEVFLAEDSAAIRARLAAMLAGVEGVTVVGEADTPEGAIEGILRTRPRSVILDIHLIGGNGIDVLRKVHSVDPSIMFIVLTNHPSPQYSRIFTSAVLISLILWRSSGIRSGAVSGRLTWRCAPGPCRRNWC